jgi:EmrB/QacA subfamily drug resistance transporter
VSLTHRQILTIFSGLMLGILLAALDQTIVATSIRVIADDLHGLSLQAWATTAYLITATISTPLYGKLSDLYGRKQFFLAAISLFVIGSVLCTIPTSMYELAAFRALQGLGAGGLFSMALAIIGDIVPARERARYQGYFIAVFGTSSVLGPLVGGFFADQQTLLGIDGWRWVFLVNVPIGLAAFVVVSRVLHLPHIRRERRIDWVGALTLAVCLVPLLIVAEQGRTWGWGSQHSLICYGIGFVGLVLFLLTEVRLGEDALIPLRLFRGSVFSITSATNLIVGMGLFGGVAVIPQYLQIVKSATPTEAGLLTLPLVVGIMGGSVLSGQFIYRTGRYKIFPVGGTALMVVGLVLFSTLTADTPLWRTDIFMVVFGLGLGGCMQTLIVAVQNAVNPKDMGVASASATFFRQMGGTLGTAVFLSILFSTVGDRIGDAFRTIAPTPEFRAALTDPAVRANPANQPVLQIVTGGGGGQNVGGVLDDSSFLNKIDPRLARPFLVGFADSISLVFLVAAAVMVVGFALVLFMRELPLRALSGIDAQASERAEAAAVQVEAAAPVEAPTEEPVVRSAPAMAAASPRQAMPAIGNRPPAVNGARSLSGQVRGIDGSPLVGARITVTDPAGRQHSRATTDGTGSYRIPAPAPGRYLVVCAADGYQPYVAEVAVHGSSTRHDATLAGSQTSAAPIAAQRVELPVLGSVVGTVRTATTGQPVADALTTLTDADGEVVASTVTGFDGQFDFDGLPLGTYTLTASGLGPQSVGVVLSPGDTAAVDLRLNAPVAPTPQPHHAQSPTGA